MHCEIRDFYKGRYAPDKREKKNLRGAPLWRRFGQSGGEPDKD